MFDELSPAAAIRPAKIQRRASQRPILRSTFDSPRSLLLPLATAALAIVIFVVDTLTGYDIAVSTFYVVVVLLSLGFCSSRGAMYVAAACVLLTIASWILTPFFLTFGNYRTGVINTGISILAVGATAYLAVKIERAREAAHDAQAQLAHVSRVTTLGELAASIAHEVNQPLTGVITNANACSRWLDAEPPNLERVSFSLNQIVAAANRASEIIGRVRTLTKRTEPRRDRVDINHAVEETLQLTHHRMLESRVVLHRNLGRDLPLVHGDGVQLQQVVLNLLINALESISARGEGEREVWVTTSRLDNGAAMLAVRDSGLGIDQASTPNLFDAFYSTKPEGMGIGLAICRSIIEAHGGQIWASANKPRGATFCFTLPCEPRPAAP